MPKLPSTRRPYLLILYRPRRQAVIELEESEVKWLAERRVRRLVLWLLVRSWFIGGRDKKTYSAASAAGAVGAVFAGGAGARTHVDDWYVVEGLVKYVWFAVDDEVYWCSGTEEKKKYHNEDEEIYLYLFPDIFQASYVVSSTHNLHVTAAYAVSPHSKLLPRRYQINFFVDSMVQTTDHIKSKA